MSRSVAEILEQARSELVDRETRLVEIQARTKSELDECRAALRRLGAKGKASEKRRVKSAHPNGNGDLGGRIVDVLKASLDPMTSGDIAERLGGLHPAGIGAALRRLEIDDKVRRVDTVDDKHRWGVPQQLDEAVRAAEVAHAMTP